MPHKTNASTKLNEGRFERMPPYPTPTPITIYQQQQDPCLIP